MAEAVGAVLSPRRPGFNSWPVGVGFMVNGVILGYVSLLVLLFSTVSIILPVLLAHSFIIDYF
jgi:hypothetical protein